MADKFKKYYPWYYLGQSGNIYEIIHTYFAKSGLKGRGRQVYPYFSESEETYSLDNGNYTIISIEKLIERIYEN